MTELFAADVEPPLIDTVPAMAADVEAATNCLRFSFMFAFYVLPRITVKRAYLEPREYPSEIEL